MPTGSALFTPPPPAGGLLAPAPAVTSWPPTASGAPASSSARTPVRVTVPSLDLAIMKCVAPGRDLRVVCHREQLLASRLSASAGKPCQPLADRARHRAADAAVDLVEDDRVGPALFGKRDLQREDEARQFAARGNFGERSKGCAGDWSRSEIRRGRCRPHPNAGRQAFDERPGAPHRA